MALAALLAFTTFDILIAYRSGVVFAAAALFAVVILAAVLYRPEVGIYIALLAVPLEYLTLRVGGDAGLSPTEGALFLTALAVGLRTLVMGEEQPMGAAHTLFGVFIVVIVLGVAYAADTFAVMKIAVTWTVLLVCSVYVASRDRETIERILVCLAVAGGIVGIVAIATSGQQQLVAGGALATGRAQGTFQQPNVLAFFLGLALPVALMLAARGRALMRALMLAAALAIVGGLVLSLSREGMIGAIVAVFVLLAWPPFRRQMFVLLAAILVVAAFNINTLTDPRGDAAIVGSRLSIVSERLGTLTQGKTVGADPRVKIWSAAPDMVADRPVLGVGAGNYSKRSPRLRRSRGHGGRLRPRARHPPHNRDRGGPDRSDRVDPLPARGRGRRAPRAAPKGPGLPACPRRRRRAGRGVRDGDRGLPAAHERDHGLDRDPRRHACRVRPPGS